MAIEKQLKYKPLFVAVVGGSGAGKSWLADRLQNDLGKEANRLSLDSFYRDRSHLSDARRAKINFDHPRAIDWKTLETFLDACAKRRIGRLPQYDFATHTRKPVATLFSPKRIILMDGLWLLRRPSLRRMFDLKVFLNCPPGLCLKRRLARDCAERGRDPASIKEQFLKTVIPMQKRFVAPQIRWADVVINHPARPGDVQLLVQQIQTLLKND